MSNEMKSNGWVPGHQKAMLKAVLSAGNRARKRKPRRNEVRRLRGGVQATFHQDPALVAG